MNRLIVLLLFVFTAWSAQAQVYRCEGPDGPWYSQLPCDEAAEPLVLEDRLMFSASPQVGSVRADGSAATDAAAAPAAETAKSPAENMQAFVERLQLQRAQQLDQLDQDIIDLEAELNATENASSDDPELLARAAELKSLYASRNSISEQYESMILEAQRRAESLAASGRPAQ